MFDDPARVDEARAICKRGCAQLIECRAWALRTDVAGMCGGFTEEERESWRDAYGVSLPKHGTIEQNEHQYRDLISLNYLRGGWSAADAGRQLGISGRTVERTKREHGFRPEDHPQAWRRNGLLHTNLGAAQRVSA